MKVHTNAIKKHFSYSTYYLIKNNEIKLLSENEKNTNPYITAPTFYPKILLVYTGKVPKYPPIVNKDKQI